jgi:hypothetical protein
VKRISSTRVVVEVARLKAIPSEAGAVAKECKHNPFRLSKCDWCNVRVASENLSYVHSLGKEIERETQSCQLISINACW